MSWIVFFIAALHGAPVLFVARLSHSKRLTYVTAGVMALIGLTFGAAAFGPADVLAVLLALSISLRWTKPPRDVVHGQAPSADRKEFFVFPRDVQAWRIDSAALGAAAGNAAATGIIFLMRLAKWGVVLVVCGAFLYFVFAGSSRHAPPPSEPTAAQEGRAVAAHSAVQQQVSPQKAEYDAEVRRVEAEYPQLNPDSVRFDREMTTRVSDRTKRYITAGLSPAKALRLAATELSSPPLPPPTVSREKPVQVGAPAAPAQRACIYKDVMSDDDYRACGISPPR